MSLSIIAKLYVVVFILNIVLNVFSIKKIYMTKKRFTVFWMIFVLSLSVIAYNMNPSISWDITFHCEYMNQIRGSGMSFTDFLFNNKNSVGGSEFKSLFMFNILRYLIAKITKNNYLLPAVCVFIDYSILGYVIIDWSLNNNGNYKTNLFTLLLSFTFMPYVHTASGMRNALCASIMGLAVYLYLYKGKNIILLIVLTFIATTIHPAAIITVPFVFLAKLKMGSLGFIAVFAFSLLAEPTAQHLAGSQISYLVLIGRKYLNYTSETQYRAARAPLYGVLLVTAIFLLIYFLLYKRFNMADDKSNKKIIYNFLAIYMVYIWGNIGNYDMVLRPAYVLGTLAPVLSSFFSDKKIWSHKGMSARIESIVSLGATAASLILCSYVNYTFLIYYGSHF